jgi:ABC-type sugar transport system ATPase subunit
MSLSDRILVMYGGRVAAEFTAAEADGERIGFFMTGGVEKGAPAGTASDVVKGGA